MLDLMIEVERYAVYKGIDKNETTVSELIEMMAEEGDE